MTLKQIKSFLILARTLNYAHAAIELHISQSALSLTIKALEEELGGKLFKRNTRKVELTEEGRSLLPYARRLIANWEEMDYDLKQRFKFNRGSLSLASMPYITHALLPNIIQQFLQTHPNINFSINDITNESVIELVKDGIFEMGICFEPEFKDQLNFQPLFEEDFLALVSVDHPLAQQDQVSWQQLCVNRFVTLQKPSIVRHLVDQYCQRHQITLDVQIECHQITSMCNFVAVGAGVTVIPRHFQAYIDNKRSVAIEMSGEKLSKPVGVIYKKNFEISKISAEFIDCLAQYPQAINTDTETKAVKPI
ncbi:LysR family carnitine catabolism transcriptional activator [Acinetobacter calcoaceticus]|uniref:LysR family carnitine catabolism transcriptional activator n=1 Tax=Acinetobacter calcoaceticus TaxID=471 RepID=A0A4R1XLG0_ACICA|nr:LysR family carnitine catabolism transcriptional activator [Acinetobacter calcoaceticus]